MSDQNSTESGDGFPSTHLKPPGDSKDNKQSTIQAESEEDDAMVLQGKESEPEETTTKVVVVVTTEDSIGRERLKRHRKEVAGRVWIPEIWGKEEELLNDWMDDFSVFNASLVPSGIVSARAALIQEGRRTSSGGVY